MTDPGNEADKGGPPPFGGRRLLYVVTGALSAAHTPFWVNWLSMSYPELEIRIAVTRSAERFATRQALAPLIPGDVFTDAWPSEAATVAPHVELAEWADTVVVNPATLSFVARLATGLADTPVMLALQCTRAAVAVAPSLPPGGVDSEVFAKHAAALRARRNVVLAPPVMGLSVTTGRNDAALNAPLPDVIAALEALRAGIGRAA
ncbi:MULTISPECIES: flavoprotein [Streptomyces]|uniref:flavoprotein n=1 Tax=Streptomyces TaxID=1883 RepID=UPI001E530A07|nr:MULTISPECIES: flavoprotein [Streptomyces]UFQ16856.1 flavoprotein [Streptomyces huasconensis]WCL86459.1 flavoprotein [Streptomyces sp. JCM 35825]